jgi:hypothetical protein
MSDLVATVAFVDKNVTGAADGRSLRARRRTLRGPDDVGA